MFYTYNIHIHIHTIYIRNYSYSFHNKMLLLPCLLEVCAFGFLFDPRNLKALPGDVALKPGDSDWKWSYELRRLFLKQKGCCCFFVKKNVNVLISCASVLLCSYQWIARRIFCLRNLRTHLVQHGASCQPGPSCRCSNRFGTFYQGETWRLFFVWEWTNMYTYVKTIYIELWNNTFSV